VEGDSVYQGRAIPLSWQIEFAPYGPEFEEANRRFAASTRRIWLERHHLERDESQNAAVY